MPLDLKKGSQLHQQITPTHFISDLMQPPRFYDSSPKIVQPKKKPSQSKKSCFQKMEIPIEDENAEQKVEKMV